MGKQQQEVFVAVDDGAVFRITVTGWPDGRAVADAPEVFGTYWPPMGVRVVEKKVRKPDREFDVDRNSDDSLKRFESDFGLYVSEKLDGFVAVHAALIAVGDAVVIVPGSSGVGKSSLCVAAMNAGWQVWSDEYCLINTTTGDVSGWPRPIRQRLAGGGVKRIDHQGAVGPGRATHVVSMKYMTKESGPVITLEEMSAGQVAMDLMANTVCARSRPEETFRATTALAKEVRGFAGSRGEAKDALEPLKDILHNVH
jgi:hypothetical protein